MWKQNNILMQETFSLDDSHEVSCINFLHHVSQNNK